MLKQIIDSFLLMTGFQVGKYILLVFFSCLLKTTFPFNSEINGTFLHKEPHTLAILDILLLFFLYFIFTLSLLMNDWYRSVHMNWHQYLLYRHYLQTSRVSACCPSCSFGQYCSKKTNVKDISVLQGKLLANVSH